MMRKVCTHILARSVSAVLSAVRNKHFLQLCFFFVGVFDVTNTWWFKLFTSSAAFICCCSKSGSCSFLVSHCLVFSLVFLFWEKNFYWHIYFVVSFGICCHVWYLCGDTYTNAEIGFEYSPHLSYAWSYDVRSIVNDLKTWNFLHLLINIVCNLQQFGQCEIE